MEHSIEYYHSELSANKARISKDLLKANSSYTYQDFENSCLDSLRTNTGLLTCESQSVLGAFLHCAGMALMPNTRYNHITVTPYYRNDKSGTTGEWTKIKEARVIIGYEGWIDIIIRNTNVQSIDAELVLKNDHFKDIRGLSPNLEHIPNQEGQRAARIAVYAIARYIEPQKPSYKVLYSEEIRKFAEISKKADPENSLWNHPERDPTGWMWKKTAIKQLAKLLPKTKSLDKAMALDNLAETGVGSVYLTKGGDLKFIESDKAKANTIIANKKQASNQLVANLVPQKNK